MMRRAHPRACYLDDRLGSILIALAILVYLMSLKVTADPLPGKILVAGLGLVGVVYSIERVSVWVLSYIEAKEYGDD